MQDGKVYSKQKQTMIDQRFGGDEQAYREYMRSLGRKGGRKNTRKNPGNFSRDRKRAVEAGRRGGKKSGETRRLKMSMDQRFKRTGSVLSNIDDPALSGGVDKPVEDVENDAIMEEFTREQEDKILEEDDHER